MKELENEIIERYNEKIDIKDIMKEFDMSEHDIRVILKENQIDRQYNTFSDELNQRIIELYEKGIKQKQIFYDLLISGNGLTKILKRNNIPKRSYSENNQKYYRDSYYFDNIDTPNKAYILGLLYADGCNYVPHHSITLSLQEQDIETLEKIKAEIKYDGPIRLNKLHEKNERYKNQCILCINDEYMSKRLETLGVVQAKSLKVVFPDFLDDNLLRHFLRGYFDGDGNIYYYEKDNKWTTQTVGTKDFCENMKTILNSIGCACNIKHPKQCGDNTFILATSASKSSSIFLSYIYENSDLKLDRKYNQYLSLYNSYLLAA